MSLRFLGLCTGNRVVSLNMVVLLGLRAEQVTGAVTYLSRPALGKFLGCEAGGR